jgi:phosphotransferase system HPr (HPr) family protein
MMPELTITINHEAGLHARPASLFVQTAGKFTSDIQVIHGEKKANAKSILSVLTLGVQQGAELKIIAEGEDEQETLQELEQLIKSNFGEGP